MDTANSGSKHGRRLAMPLLLWCLMIPLASQVHAADAEPEDAKAEIPDPTKAASNPLSDAGTSGFFLYRKHCQSCHGDFGSGTDRVAALLNTEYSNDHRTRRDFHRNFRAATPEHIKVARGTRKNPGPGFNELELVGKFLREIQAWHVMLKSMPK